MVGLMTRKKGAMGIKIKPFAKPPTLPDNFYASSTDILWFSLESILQRKATITVKGMGFSSGSASPTTSASDPQASNNFSVKNVPSREELFGKVQDLCRHGFGPKLYLELIDILDKSAFSCVSRLVQSQGNRNSGDALNGSYSMINCETDGARIYFKTLDEQTASPKVLENILNVFSDFVQFLNCVINIFMSLDRMFLYIPPGNDQAERKVLQRSVSNISNKDSVRSGSSITAWDLWDVGMYAIWKHLAMKETSKAVPMDCSTDDVATYSVLHVLRRHTVTCIIAEFDELSSSSTYSDSNKEMSIEGISDFLHRPLIRNCASIFRALAHVSLHQAKTSANDLFLDDLVEAMTDYLKNESQQRLSDAIALDPPAKTAYDAISLIHHVDKRLKQALAMTNYYHLVQETSSSKYLSPSRGPNRLLTSLVEMHLLTPHFTPQLILHPSNLYPILDNEELNDTKILFLLSKRVASSSKINPGPTNSNVIIKSPGMELLRQSFASYAKERGISIMRPPVAPIPMTAGNVAPLPSMSTREMNNKIITNLLKFKSHLEHIHRTAFGGDEFFGRTLKKVLEDVINDGGADDEDLFGKKSGRHASGNCDGGKRIAELLAKFIDLRFKNSKTSLVSSPMKNGQVRTTPMIDDDNEAFQEAVLDLFRLIQSKDVFEAFYRQDLSKRLLQNKSSSIDNERSFTSRLKSECGAGYVSKMEGMFKDIELSREVMTTYSAYEEGRKNDPTFVPSDSKVDMEVQILTTGYWPLDKKYPDIILPSHLLTKQTEFETYYKSKYQGRRITWQPGLGNCVVKATFPKVKGPRDLIVSLCQAIVLLCFNDDDESSEEKRLTIIDVMRISGMTDRTEAERILQSLSMGRDGTQVLKRIDSERINTSEGDSDSTTPKKKFKSTRKSVSDSDVFVFNSDFTTNQRRIRITNIQIKEANEDRQKIHEFVTLDRLHLIDAAIVRIMKSRKTLGHRDLVGEVLNQLKFPAAGVDIKKRIESLIEREYMERAEGDRSRYNYLA
jgi:cullin-4